MRDKNIISKFTRRIFFKMFKRYRRLEMKRVAWQDGDILIRSNEGKPENEQWVIAREEDNNFNYGWVYLERRERILG